MIIIYDELNNEQAERLDQSLLCQHPTLHMIDADGLTVIQLMDQLRPALDHDEIKVRVNNAFKIHMFTFQSRHLDRWLMSCSAVVISGDTHATRFKTELPVEPITSYNLSPYNHGPGGGMWKPGVSLLIGERANYKGTHFFLVPFASMTRVGCSAWLTEQLIMHGVMEGDLYWINAQQLDGTWTDHRFVQALEPKQIIALGGTAERWCKLHHLNHQAVTHPQFHRRFKSKEHYPLLDLL